MKKEQAIAILSGDPALFEDAFPSISTYNGYPFKDVAAYDSVDVCYISEFALDDLRKGYGDESCFYDKEDFIAITGDEERARLLFDAVDWQTPEAYYDEDPEAFDEEEE